MSLKVMTNKHHHAAMSAYLCFPLRLDTHFGPCCLQTGFLPCLLANLLTVSAGRLKRFPGRARSLTLLRVVGTTCWRRCPCWSCDSALLTLSSAIRYISPAEHPHSHPGSITFCACHDCHCAPMSVSTSKVYSFWVEGGGGGGGQTHVWVATCTATTEV